MDILSIRDSGVCFYGYTWHLPSKRYNGLEPTHFEIQYSPGGAVQKGIVNFGERGVSPAQENSKQKNNWDNMLYPNRFNGMKWKCRFRRDAKTWRILKPDGTSRKLP